MKRLVLSTLFLSSFALSQEFNVSNTQEFREALEDAALNGESDTITLEEGVYKTTDDGLGVFLFADSQEQNLTIRAKDGDVILSGDSSSAILKVSNSSDNTLFLENLTFTNANVSGYALESSDDLVLNSVDVINNSSRGVLASGDIEIEDSNISYNQLTETKNGIGVSGVKVSIKDSIISYNISQSYEGKGGGVYGTLVTISNSQITYNQNGTRSSGSGAGGGGVYGNIVSIIDSNISYNQTGGYGGGGILAYKSLDINNSHISNNITHMNKGGGGISSPSGTVNIYNCVIEANQAELKGAGVYAQTSNIANSKIINNTTVDDGMSSHTQYGVGVLSTYTNIINTIFKNNSFTIEKNSQGASALSSSNIKIINSNFIENQNIAVSGKGIFVNNIFDNQSLNFTGESYLYNNYINYNNLQNDDTYTIYKKSNIQPDSNETLEYDALYTPIVSSSTIDSALALDSSTFKELFDTNTYEDLSVYFNTDLLGNIRVNGSALDMGAVEYGSTKYSASKPFISLSFSGDQKVYSTISFDLNISLFENRDISELYVDLGEGYYTLISNQTSSLDKSFTNSGLKEIKVKVVDSEGESSESALELNIYDLTTTEAIEYGKSLCLEDLNSCGVTQSGISSEYIDSLDSGWHLLGTTNSLDTIDTTLESAKIVWYFDSESNSWRAFSSDTNTSDIIKDSEYEELNSIPSNSGFWIIK